MAFGFWIFLALLALVIVGVIVWFVVCAPDWCRDVLPKLWQGALIAGIVFIYFGSCPLCFATLIGSLLVWGVLLLLLGAGLLLWWVLTCRPSRCETVWRLLELGVINTIIGGIASVIALLPVTLSLGGCAALVGASVSLWLVNILSTSWRSCCHRSATSTRWRRRPSDRSGPRPGGRGGTRFGAGWRCNRRGRRGANRPACRWRYRHRHHRRRRRFATSVVAIAAAAGGNGHGRATVRAQQRRDAAPCLPDGPADARGTRAITYCFRVGGAELFFDFEQGRPGGPCQSVPAPSSAVSASTYNGTAAANANAILSITEGLLILVTIKVPFAIRKRGGRTLVLAPDGAPMPPAAPQVDNTLVKAIARAFRWQKMLETGRYATIKEIAKAEKINPSYVSRVLRLTLLAPATVEAILDGRADGADAGEGDGAVPGRLVQTAIGWPVRSGLAKFFTEQFTYAAQGEQRSGNWLGISLPAAFRRAAAVDRDDERR